MLKAVFFDLDSTLLPMNEEEFTKGYFKLLCKKLMPLGYESEKIVSAIWDGTKRMVKNDGTKTNEEVFWDRFAEIYGEDKLKDKDIVNAFYTQEFGETKRFCEPNLYAKTLVDLVKGLGLKVVLATNPIFPLDGIDTRLGFIGLRKADFDYISSYEVSHYSKPNPKYYVEILNKLGLKPEEVLMFGNSETEDAEAATAAGIKTYLVGEHLLLKGESTSFPCLRFDEVEGIIKQNLNK